MQTITMLEIRRDTRGLLRKLARGECFTVTYRNRPVGELRPIPQRSDPSPDDPAYQLGKQAEDLGGGLDARTADRLLY